MPLYRLKKPEDGGGIKEVIEPHGELHETMDGGLNMGLYPGMTRSRRETFVSFIDGMRQQSLLGQEVDIKGLKGKIVSTEGLSVVVEYDNFIPPAIQGPFLRAGSWIKKIKWKKALFWVGLISFWVLAGVLGLYLGDSI